MVTALLMWEGMVKFVCPSINKEHRFVYISTDPSDEHVILSHDTFNERVFITGDPQNDHIYIETYDAINRFPDWYHAESHLPEYRS